MGNTVEVLKTDELYRKLLLLGAEITGIQETRRKHESGRRDVVNFYPDFSGYAMYTISAWENESKVATGGLDLILGKASSQELLIGYQDIRPSDESTVQR